MDTSFRSNCRSIVAVAAILCLAGWYVHRLCNPQHINHLVLIRERPDANASPATVELHGEVDWTQVLEFHGGPAPQGRANLLAVADIYAAWFGGTLSIYDSDGALVTRTQLRPPGRYCGALVVLLTERGETLTAWNQLPVRK